jgi:hypothetical protein
MPPSYRPVFATVSTIHAVVAKPPIAVALRGACVPEMFYRRSTSRFDLTQNRREVEHGRLQCAMVPCAVRRVSPLRNDSVQGTLSRKYFDASGSWSTRITVMLLRA